MFVNGYWRSYEVDGKLVKEFIRFASGDTEELGTALHLVNRWNRGAVDSAEIRGESRPMYIYWVEV